MKRSVRRVIFYLFIAAFCVLAPLVVLYTAGYRFSIKHGIDLDKGSLSVTTVPRRVDIVINGVHTRKRSPNVFQELRAGRYEVKLERAGYLPWLGTVHVIPGLTTHLQHIFLFRESAPELVTPTLGTEDQVVTYENTIAYTQGGNLLLGNLLSGNTEIIDSLPETTDNAYQLSWSKDGSYLLLQSENHISVYTNVGAPISLPELDEMPTELFWDVIEGNYLYLVFSEHISLFDLTQPQSPTTLPVNALGVVDGSLFATKELFASTILTVRRGQTEQEITRLPLSNYKIIDLQGSYLVLQDAQRDLYLVQPATGNIVEIPVRATFHDWNKEALQFVYASDMEIGITTPQQFQHDILLRFSDTLKGSVWHPNGQRILFATPTTLEAIDAYQYSLLRDRVELARFDAIEQFWLDSNGRTAYILGTQEDVRGVYALRLR